LNNEIRSSAAFSWRFNFLARGTCFAEFTMRKLCCPNTHERRFEMKNTALRIALVVVAATWLTTLAFAADDHKGHMPAKGKEVTISGMMTCTYCKLMNPEKKPDAECCRHCVKNGESPLLTDSKGEQYILLTGEKGVPLMNQERMDMLGEMVTVKGMLVKGKGVQAIYVDKMVKMAGM